MIDRYFIVTIACTSMTCLLLGYLIGYTKGFKKSKQIDDMILDEKFKSDGGENK